MHADRSSRWTVAAVTVFLCLAGGGAGHARARSRPSPTWGTTSSSLVVISRQELLRAADSQSLMAAIRLTRPTWFTGRASGLGVSVNGSPMTDLSLLSSISVSDVAEVRLVRASQGGARARVTSNGDVVTSDLILVLTRLQ
jgi:hypothetical protein